MEHQSKKPAAVMIILAFAIVYVVWGSTYFFIQKAIGDFPPFLLGAVRFLAAGIIMLGWSWMRGEQLFVVKDIRHAIVSGFLMLFIGTGAVIWVEQTMPSAMVAIMVSSGPLWFILLDRAKWAQNFKSKATIWGLVIGFAGVIVLFSENIIEAFSQGSDIGQLLGFAILVVGSMAWAGGSLYSKYHETKISVTANTSWQMLAAGVAFIPGSLFRGEFTGMRWSEVSTGGWLSLAYLIIFGSIIGFSAYVWLLKVRPVTQVSTHAYVNPVVAVLLGVFFASEDISMLQIGGLVIILTSVLLVNLAKYRENKLPAHKDDSMEEKEIILNNTLKMYKSIPAEMRKPSEN